MKPSKRLLFAGLIGCMALASATAETKAPAPHEMTTYYLGLLVKGVRWSGTLTPELEKLQEQHLAHIGRMAEAGQLFLAGPLADNGTIRGILVFQVDSLEDAEALASQDPAVVAGHLALELHPWLVPKGMLP